MHKNFEINPTKIKCGCQSGRKVVTHNSKSDLPLGGSSFCLIFQPSPWCFTLCILFTATMGNLPSFFEFNLIYDGDEPEPDFWTTDLYEDPRYIKWSSYHELIITGIFPLLALCYYNYEIYARIRLSCLIELGRYVGGK